MIIISNSVSFYLDNLKQWNKKTLTENTLFHADPLVHYPSLSKLNGDRIVGRLKKISFINYKSALFDSRIVSMIKVRLTMQGKDALNLDAGMVVCSEFKWKSQSV